jgi:hypothetical protein
MGKEISLDALSKSVAHQQKTTTNNQKSEVKNTPHAPETMKPVSMAELGKELEIMHPEESAAKKQASEKINPEIITDAFSSLDRTIAEKKANADRMVEQVKEAVEQEQFEKDTEENEESIENNTKSLDEIEYELDNELLDDDEDSSVEEQPEPEVSKPAPVNMQASQEAQQSDNDKPKVVEKTTKIPASINDNGDDDLDGLLNDLNAADEAYDVKDDEEETPEELRAKFKERMGSIVSSKDPIDFSQYKIREKPVSASRLLDDNNVQATKKKADWALYYTKRNVTFFECDGPELDALRKTIRNSNGVNGVIASLRFIYNHIIDADKPSFEAWTKMIRTEDIESLYFGLYLACYGDSNLMARTHDSKTCNKTSLIETDVYKMVKFESDEVKAEFDTIRSMDSTTPTKEIEGTLMQISDDYVISFLPATLYSTFVQYSTLKPEITQKYSDILNTMAYVDQFFKIDRESKELVRMAIKEYPGNINKTVISKLKTYVKLLKTLSTDQYNILTGKLENLIEDPKVTYIYPAAECPECGEEIPEEAVDSMLNLLFTRAQLAQIKSL